MSARKQNKYENNSKLKRPQRFQLNSRSIRFHPQTQKLEHVHVSIIESLGVNQIYKYSDHACSTNRGKKLVLCFLHVCSQSGFESKTYNCSSRNHKMDMNKKMQKTENDLE